MKQHTQYYGDKSSIIRFTPNQPVKVKPVVVDKISERPIKKQKLNDSK
jgi:hypothetical protein